MLCYSKPMLLMVDDNDSFLSITKKYLERNLGNNSVISTFSNDKQITEFLEKNKSAYNSPKDLYHDYKSQFLNLDQLLTELENYSPILIIDHNLQSSLTGTEICKIAKSTNQAIKIILLTGEVDYKQATELHNHGIIDYFFKKDERDLISKISNIITTIINNRQKDFYFDGELHITDDVDIILEAEYKLSLNQLLKDINYMSYIITNNNGDIMLRDTHNKTFSFQKSDIKGMFKANGTSNI